jgi:DNA-3-methyladenine glycosylase I
MDADLPRCSWASGPDFRMREYHDREWGVITHDARDLFELLTLEGAQAGLSWSTILNRREGYRRAFANFEIEAVAAFGPDDEARLLGDTGIVRNRAKIASTIANARAAAALRQGGSALPDLLWSFVDGRPIVNRWSQLGETPAETAESRAMSKGLKRLGFTFVGPTICYALMQSAGLVNDHLTGCYRWSEVQREPRSALA